MHRKRNCIICDKEFTRSEVGARTIDTCSTECKKKYREKNKRKKKKIPKEQQKKRGRPTICTPEKIAQLEQAFALGCSDLEACLYAGITKTTLYSYQDKNPGFAARKQLLKETPTIRARKSVVKALDSDHSHALRYLERKKKDEFGLKVGPEDYTQIENVKIYLPEKNK